jgi:hypothetical protein
MLPVLFGLMAALPVQVQSEACPSGPEIEQELQPLLPPLPEHARPDLARVVNRQQGVHVELVNPAGVVLAERELPRRGSCGEMAAMIAVMIASWQSDVHPQFARPHPELGDTVAGRPLQPPRSPPLAVSAYDLGLGVSVSYADTFAAGGASTGTWLPRGRGPGLRMSAALESRRSLDLAGGSASWRRWMGTVEGDFRLQPGRLAVDLHGGLGLGLLSASGVSFIPNQRRYSFSPAPTLGARLSWWTTRRISIWLDVSALYWLRSQVLYTLPSGTREKIPDFQVFASLGLAIGQSVPER